MSEQTQGQQDNLSDRYLEQIEAQRQQQAIIEFERWVNESQQIDAAYSNGTLDKFMEKKLEREINEFNKGHNNGG